MKSKLHKVKQMDNSDCGVACLASVLGSHGIETSLTQLRLLSGTTSSGTTIKGIIEASEQFGVKARGYKSSMEALKTANFPIIIHLRKESILHYIVIYNFSKGFFTTMDPINGELEKVHSEIIEKEFTGYLILFDINNSNLLENNIANTKLAKGKKTLFKAILKDIIYPIKWNLIKIFTLSILNIILSLSTAFYIRYLLDYIIPSGDVNSLYKLSLLMLLMVTSSIMITLFKATKSLKLSLETDKRIVGDLIDHILRVPLPFFKGMKKGEITSRIGDAYKLRNLIIDSLPEAIIGSLTLIISIIVLIFTDITLALLLLIFSPMYIAIFLIYDKISKRVLKENMEKSALLNISILENINSISTIKNYGLENTALATTKLKLSDLNNSIQKAGKIGLIADSSIDLIWGITTISILSVGGFIVISHNITSGQLISFFTIAAIFSTPLKHVASMIYSFREGTVAASRIYDIKKLPPEYSYDTTNHTYTNINNLVKPNINTLYFKNITFSYPGRAPLINNLSFSCTSSKITLIWGKSGCGKSTLVNLLSRHYQIKNGTIEFNNTSISHLDIKEWRSCLSIVPQDPELYGDTIYECITGEKPSNQKDPLSLKAKTLLICEKLKIKEIIDSLPNGFLTNPGESGAHLSRGQQQRISFARAVIREPHILILDEATSSLDYESASLIENYIIEYKKQNAIIIMISHKLSDKKIADKIITL